MLTELRVCRHYRHFGSRLRALSAGSSVIAPLSTSLRKRASAERL
uniref:Uncharacterized protein n=1 Tax=Anguilla anguilla TaxID=7936 RepID=A0A0E9P620_ANGAN